MRTPCGPHPDTYHDHEFVRPVTLALEAHVRVRREVEVVPVFVPWDPVPRQHRVPELCAAVAIAQGHACLDKLIADREGEWAAAVHLREEIFNDAARPMTTPKSLQGLLVS